MFLSYTFKYFKKIFSLCIYDFQEGAGFQKQINVNLLI